MQWNIQRSMYFLQSQTKEELSSLDLSMCFVFEDNASESPSAESWLGVIFFQYLDTHFFWTPEAIITLSR